MSSTKKAGRGAGRGRRPAARTAPTRLTPAERRRDLLRVAAEVMTRDGVDAVVLGDVAAAGGVSRQFVYRFFPSRQALIRAVLEDFADALREEFGRRVLHGLPRNLEEATHVFVEAVCTTIERKGAGPWHLLDSRGPDPEIGRLGQEILEQLVAPWHGHIAQATNAGSREAAIVARMLVAAGRAVLDLWCTGEITREEAVRHAARGVTALLEAVPAAPPRRAPRRRSRPA